MYRRIVTNDDLSKTSLKPMNCASAAARGSEREADRNRRQYIRYGGKSS